MLTREQQQAIDMIHAFARHPTKQVCKLGGYAGTGKTTTIQHLINQGGVPGKALVCCAPTGKAAQVLGHKLNGFPVRTVHSLIYQPSKRTGERLFALQQRFRMTKDQSFLPQIEEEKKRVGELMFVEKETSIGPRSFVICDEASMVSPKMVDDLKKTGAKILFVGDPGQLPPVKAQQFFNNPDFVLQTVHRQALESPIIQASLAIREGKGMPGNSEAFRRVAKGETTEEEYLSAGVILCGKNATRLAFNKYIRNLKGMTSKLPEDGETVICTKNDLNNSGLVNGQIATTLGVPVQDPFTGDWSISLKTDFGTRRGLDFCPEQFLAHYHYGLNPTKNILDSDLLQLTYGYCLTAHKSQGSEWGSVILADDSKGGSFDRKAWLYTAITRAKEKLIWIES